MSNQGRQQVGRYMVVLVVVMNHSGKETEEEVSIMAKDGSVMVIMAKGMMGNLQAIIKGTLGDPSGRYERPMTRTMALTCSGYNPLV
jgi:hypothetical protein